MKFMIFESNCTDLLDFIIGFDIRFINLKKEEKENDYIFSKYFWLQCSQCTYVVTFEKC